MNEIVQRAKEIIFSMEGHYSSVNCNDNGALSLGCCQWHGDRAKQLLKAIIDVRTINPTPLINNKLWQEINSNKSWSNRIITSLTEKKEISALLNSASGRTIQDSQANIDIEKYIKHVKSIGFKDEECIIFLADIENQGGAGSSNRIGRTALADYGYDVTLDELLKVALEDKVFCKYQARRLQVYKKLVKHNAENQTATTGLHTSYYTVKGRDNLSAIAKKFNTTVEQIVKDNKIENKNIIIVGQKLKIESGVKL